jgi:ComF family protein
VINILRKTDIPFELVAMPLTPARHRERGFNQAEVIADYLASQFAFQKANVLIRTNQKSVPQASLPHNNERFHNIKGSFVLREGARCAGRHFLLIDDIVTTGATVREAARVLKRAGASEVSVFSLAKG